MGAIPLIGGALARLGLAFGGRPAAGLSFSALFQWIVSKLGTILFVGPIAFEFWQRGGPGHVADAVTSAVDATGQVATTAGQLARTGTSTLERVDAGLGTLDRSGNVVILVALALGALLVVKR